MIKIKYVLFLMVLHSSYTYGKALQSQWQELYQSVWQQAAYTLTQKEMNQTPQALWEEAARYPNFKRFNWHDLRLLNQVSTLCQSIPYTGTKLKRAIEFELALCEGKSLSADWFQSGEVLHPAGGGYADRYLKVNKANSDQKLLDIHPYTMVTNPLNPLYLKLSSLSSDGKAKLLNGYRAWLEGGTLWLSGDTGWKAVPASIWQPLAKKAHLTLRGESCTIHYSNLCISEQSSFSISLQMMLILAGTICFLFIGRLSALKLKQRRERRFILQLLTHELRTPITSLGLTIDMFRQSFERLDIELQDAFWRLLSDYQRLTQLTENSKTYLSASNKEGLLKQNASLAEWLAFYCEKNGVSYEIEKDYQLNLPYYWLAVCLENLINNAKQHGLGEVKVKVYVSKQLLIEVTDEGHFPSMLRRWCTTKRVNKDHMGVGLEIVAHLMKRANGKLVIHRNPTRCILELPYEHDSIN